MSDRKFSMLKNVFLLVLLDHVHTIPDRLSCRSENPIRYNGDRNRRMSTYAERKLFTLC